MNISQFNNLSDEDINKTISYDNLEEGSSYRDHKGHDFIYLGFVYISKIKGQSTEFRYTKIVKNILFLILSIMRLLRDKTRTKYFTLTKDVIEKWIQGYI